MDIASAKDNSQGNKECHFYKDHASTSDDYYLVLKATSPIAKHLFLPKRCIYCGEPIELLNKQTALSLTPKLLPRLIAISSSLIAVIAFGIFLKGASFTTQLMGLLVTLTALAVLLWDSYQLIRGKEKVIVNYGVCTHRPSPFLEKLVKWTKWLSYLALVTLVVLWLSHLISLFALAILSVILLLAMLGVYRSRKFIVLDRRSTAEETIFWIKIVGASERFFSDLPPLTTK